MTTPMRRRPLHDDSHSDDSEGEVAAETTEQQDDTVGEVERVPRPMRRSLAELTVGSMYHFAVLCFYVYVHVYDATLMKKCPQPDKFFIGSNSYGGRWKYLTFINLWLQLVYFFLAFFTDIMPQSSVKLTFQKFTDLAFATFAFPFGTFVTIAFWGLYGIDREGIYPAFLDEYLPQDINHYWHTTVALCVLIEAILVFHRYPSTFTSNALVFAYSTAYVVWSVSVYTKSGKWAYPFLHVIPVPLIPVFFAACFFFTLFMFYVGRWINYYRWTERHLYYRKKEEEDEE